MHELEDGILDDSEIYFLLPSEFATEHLFCVQHLGIFHCDSRYYVTHPYWESIQMFFIDEGELQVSYRNRKYALHKNDIMLLDCRYDHHYLAPGDLRFHYFHFTGPQSSPYTELLYQLNGGAVLPDANTAIIDHTFQNLHTLAQTSITTRLEHRASTFIQLILTELIEYSYGEISQKKNDIVAQAISYMKENLSENPSLDEIADHVGVSKFHFSRLFKQSTGSSPHQYFNSLRLQKAQSLLTTTHAPLDEIAAQCGFDTSSNFIRLFKKHTGITPNTFRKIPF